MDLLCNISVQKLFHPSVSDIPLSNKFFLYLWNSYEHVFKEQLKQLHKWKCLQVSGSTTAYVEKVAKKPFEAPEEAACNLMIACSDVTQWHCG